MELNSTKTPKILPQDPSSSSEDPQKWERSIYGSEQRAQYSTGQRFIMQLLFAGVMLVQFTENLLSTICMLDGCQVQFTEEL